MMKTRAQRRAMKRKADTVAGILASSCYDFHGGGTVAVTHPVAIAALRRAFALVLRSGGKPVAVPLSEAEAEAFPRYRADRVPGGVTWLAAGLDPEERATYALQSAGSTDRAEAHEVARMLALARLAFTAATPGFPITETRGTA
ncbi:hypothetical protein [Frigidibacter sp. MR17.24]|uniref:hypothetical protein n=1 Tax=Frigidibacter sp. MR17.24 TaxID=3127345 RepID=UPI0030130388